MVPGRAGGGGGTPCGGGPEVEEEVDEVDPGRGGSEGGGIAGGMETSGVGVISELQCIKCSDSESERNRETMFPRCRGIGNLLGRNYTGSTS